MGHKIVGIQIDIAIKVDILPITLARTLRIGGGKTITTTIINIEEGMITTRTPTEISYTVFPTMKASWQQAESNTKGLTTTNLNNIKLTNIKLGGIISSGKLW